MPNRKRAPKRRNRRSRMRGKSRAPTTRLPLVIARGVSLMRSIQLYTRVSDATWLDTLSYLGMMAMKLYLGEISEGTSKTQVPLGSLQSMLIYVDDLIVNGPMAKSYQGKTGAVKYRTNFCKAKLRSLCISLSSTAAPANRSGRMGLLFVWFSEAEALNAAKELSTVQTADPPNLETFFQTPGVIVNSVTSKLVRRWEPPANSWVRDYVNLGTTIDQTTPPSGQDVVKGLPVGRLIVGFQTLASKTASSSYATEDSSLLLELGGVVDLAEMGERSLQNSFSTELDADKAYIYRPSGPVEVDRKLLTQVGRFLEFRRVGADEDISTAVGRFLKV